MSRLSALAALALTLSLPALAQDDDDPWALPSDDDTPTDEPSEDPPADDPWAQPSSDDDSEDTSTDEPAADEPAADTPAPTGPVLGEPVDDVITGPGFGEPADSDLLPTDEATAPPEGEVAGPGFGDPTDDETADGETGPVVAVPSPAETDERGIGGGNVPRGMRIEPYGASTGVDLAQAFVVGSNGGTNQTTFRARYARGKYGVQLGIPFVAHRMPRQPRDTGLGNLQLDAWRQIGSGEDGYTGIGIEAHTNLGDRTYAWVHEADEIWPSTGLDVALQARRGTDELGTMARVALGVRGGRDYAPWAGSYLTFEVAFGVHAQVMDRVGVVGEMSVAYWDLSPWDLSGLVWVDIAHGLRARGGLVFPLGVWTGLARVDEDFRGLKETTAMLDLSLSL